MLLLLLQSDNNKINMFKRLFTTLSLTLISIMMFAQMDSVFLYSEGVPGLKDTSIQESKVANDDGLLRWRNVVSPTITAYIPESADKKTPAVVICPGGGYGIVSIESEGYNVAEWLQERGVAAFVLKYRLPNDAAFVDKKIVPLQDVQQSFKYIIEHAKEYNIDTKNIGVMGFSAGGHLAGTASVLYKDPLVDVKAKYLRPAFSVLVYPVITFTDKFPHKGTRKNLIGPEWTEEEELYYSCEKQVDKKTPPTFLLHAKDDKTVPYQNSVIYKEALDAYGVDNIMVLLEKGGHGFGVQPKKATNIWLDDLEAWLLSEGIIE